MNAFQALHSRREFIFRTVAGSSLLLTPLRSSFAAAGALASCPLVVFSKIYQELKLGFAEAARLTQEAGLDGIDCPVRRGGEIEPAQAAEKLPEYSAILRKHGVEIRLLTSGITDASSDHVETVLRTSRGLGVKFYRLGFFKPSPGDRQKQIAEVRARLKDLAALNRQLGVCGLFQNHSGSFGANLSELLEAVRDTDPREIGVAFDIGHAMIAHGKEWHTYFEQIKPHLRIVYIKDVNDRGEWVRFGEGQIASSGYMSKLAEIGYSEPVSLHIEFDWSPAGTGRNRETLLKALRESNTVLRQWLKEA